MDSFHHNLLVMLCLVWVTVVFSSMSLSGSPEHLSVLISTSRSTRISWGFLREFFLPLPQIFCEVLSIKVTGSFSVGIVLRCLPLRVVEWCGPDQDHWEGTGMWWSLVQLEWRRPPMRSHSLWVSLENQNHPKRVCLRVSVENETRVSQCHPGQEVIHILLSF